MLTTSYDAIIFCNILIFFVERVFILYDIVHNVFECSLYMSEDMYEGPFLMGEE